MFLRNRILLTGNRDGHSQCHIRPDCHHDFDASGTSNAMFDELAERSLMSPLAGTKHTYVTLAIIIHCKTLALFSNSFLVWKTGTQKEKTKERTLWKSNACEAHFKLLYWGKFSLRFKFLFCLTGFSYKTLMKTMTKTAVQL